MFEAVDEELVNTIETLIESTMDTDTSVDTRALPDEGRDTLQNMDVAGLGAASGTHKTNNLLNWLKTTFQAP